MLAEGDVEAALGALQRAREAWQQLDVPYQAARVQALLGQTCRMLGDEEGAAMEMAAARAEFERLGAAPDAARVGAMATPGRSRRPRGLTDRELEVLRMVADGKTNRAIADELSLSVKTVDRQVSNIFDKLGIASRAAAVAHAYQDNMV